jgi:hypothetical protein
MTSSPKINISAIMNKSNNFNSPKKDELEAEIEKENQINNNESSGLILEEEKLSTNNLDDNISISEKIEESKAEEINPKFPHISI